MINALYILSLVALCACLNRFRGMKSWCAHLYGGVLAVVLTVKLGWLFLLGYPLFIFGECFGWGDFIGGLIEHKNEESNRMLLSIRGAWWWAGICLLFAWNATPLLPVLSVVFILSVGFPLCVEAATALKVKNPWALAEFFYGAVQGLMIGILAVWQ
jgi:hypothetical protein